MSVNRLRFDSACVLGALVLLEATALAQPASPQPTSSQPASPQDDKDVEAKRSEARAYFEKGNALLKQEAWDEALAEFTRSRASYPTRAATKNAALCLQSLRRFDEALEMFEEVLKFSNLPDEERRLVMRASAELQEQMGTLQIEGGESGASLVIDGRYRGTLPLRGPVRVTAGSHEVRAFKEGADPSGVTLEIGKKQSAVAQLRSLGTGGRLKVRERRGRTLDVVVDGTVVGKTPWEGPLTVGDHLVTLRGSVDLDAIPECATGDEHGAAKRAAPRGSVDLGTQPVSVPIHLRELTPLTLEAESLDTTLRIEPTPGGAQVAIDSVVVGNGAWEGRLRVGEHKVEVSANGFLSETRRVSLEKQRRQVMKIELDRDRESAGFQLKRRIAAGSAFGVSLIGLGIGTVAGSMALAKSTDVRSHCSEMCFSFNWGGKVSEIHKLGKISTAGFAIGGVGLAAGVGILLFTRTGGSERRHDAARAKPPPASSFTWRADLGPGRLNVEGSF